MNLRRNGIFSAAEVVVNGICLFLIYRNVAQVLGVSMLGVWALVLATSAFGRAADLGISGSISRYVARSLGEGRGERALAYMRTGLIFMALTMGLVALALWWPLWHWLALALNGAELSAARAVLPWAVLSFWLLVVKTAFDSSLIGVFRADLRAIAGITGMLVQLLFSYLLVGDHGLFGLAWAQVGQFAIAIAMEIVFLLTIARVHTTGKSPWFSLPVVKEMLGFGLKLQLGSIANLMFEPAVKTLIAAFAGTYVLGIFEMAYRTAYQVRNVATMALQPTVAALASLSATGGDGAATLFRRITKVAAVSAAVLMSGIAVTSPIVSWLYLDRVDPLFVYTAGVMAIMWGSTILAAPAYYYGVAFGKVGPYVVSEFLAVIVACIAIAAFGAASSPLAMIVGVALGKLSGSVVLAAASRPTPAFSSSVVANPTAWVSSAVLAAVSGGVIAISLIAI